MIGNIDYIIDNVAAKYGWDRKTVEVVSSEMFKAWKYKMTNSTSLSIYVPKLGHWVGMCRKMKNYIHTTIRKLRKTRAKIASGTVEPEKMQRYLEIEQIYIKNIRITLKQLNALRTIFYEYRQRKIKKYGKTLGVSKAN